MYIVLAIGFCAAIFVIYFRNTKQSFNTVGQLIELKPGLTKIYVNKDENEKNPP